MGRLGGARARLRQRRRRAVRARPAARRRRGGGAAGRDAGRQRAAPAARAARRRTRRSRSTPTCGRRASRARWCARWAPTRAYYERWSLAWEAQALLRADAGRRRRGPGRALRRRSSTRCAGRPAGSPRHDVREIRRIKARVEAERLPRGADPTPHLKLGRGGLADVEWTVQLLQLQHAARGPGAAHHLARWRRWRRPPRPGCSPRPTPRCSPRPGGWPPGCATPPCCGAAAPPTRCPPSCGSSTGSPGSSATRRRRPAQLDEDYQRTTRRARAVVERIFYG